MSLRHVATRLAPALRQSFRVLGTTANAGVFAWTRPGRAFSSATTSPLAAANHNNVTWSETLSFSSPESDFVTALDNAQFAPGHERPLPLTWREALHMQDEPIVITTAQSPHRVVHVNAAWESLCGYSKSEALHQPIGPLLQQGEHKSHTNQAARHLIHQLQADQYAVEHDAYLENFTKNGRAFLNHLRVGPLYLDPKAAKDHTEPDFLIGVLQEVQKEDVPLRMVV